jgi:hypothetical protein
MPEQLDIFIRDPITVTIALRGGVERTLEVNRLVARHAGPWEQFWSSLPTLDDSTLEDAIEREIEIVKAGIPEPRAKCPTHCMCQSNVGLHALIEQLDRQQLDALFEAVLRVNGPKELPDPANVPAAAVSGSTRRSLARLLLGCRRVTRLTSQSKNSAT